MRSHARIAPLSALVLLCGCQPTQLYVAHSTVVGVNAAISTEKVAGHLKIGYERDFATVVPKSVPAPGGREAMGALSCSELEVTGIFLTGFKEYLATGEAAERYAALFKPKPAPPADASKTGVTSTGATSTTPGAPAAGAAPAAAAAAP